MHNVEPEHRMPKDGSWPFSNGETMINDKRFKRANFYPF